MVLHKLSSPGFTLETDTIGHVVNVLSGFICSTCMHVEQDVDYVDGDGSTITFKEGIPAGFGAMSFKDQMDVLLSTPCGYEFMLEKEDK